MNLNRITIFLISVFTLYASAAAAKDYAKRDYIQMVGSSTVYPFATTIAEEFGRNSGFKTPVVEATGTGGGFKLFCEGIGYGYPDFVNASREIKPSEVKKCKENGVKRIIEIKIGNDALVLANSVKGIKFNLTEEEVFLALAKEIPDAKSARLIANPHTKWNQINSKLPDVPIAVYGPPPTSGTRDSFAELVMEKVCLKNKIFASTYPDAEKRKKQCQLVRSDGKFIEAGENDNLIVQKLSNNPNALGIFGFSFLEENQSMIKSVAIDGIEPTFKNAVSKKYELIRPLFIYYKKENVDLVPGMKELVAEILSKDTIGKDGYLMQKGLIPLQ